MRADFDDFASCIVAGDAFWCYWPGISAVGDVCVSVVQGDGVDFDQDSCWMKGQRKVFGDEVEPGTAWSVVICTTKRTTRRDLRGCHRLNLESVSQILRRCNQTTAGSVFGAVVARKALFIQASRLASLCCEVHQNRHLSAKDMSIIVHGIMSFWKAI